MYLKVNQVNEILERSKDIQRIATLETCGIPELVKLYHENERVRLWFDSWIVDQAKTIQEVIENNQ